jgi:prefoldin subunit 5
VEKINRFLEEIQQRIKLLQQDAASLTEVKAQLGRREAQRRGI